MRRTRFQLLLAVLFAFAVAAAACGDDADPVVEAPNSTESAAAPDDESAEAPAVEATPAEDYTIATVVKLVGVAWFDRMEEGTIKFGEDNEGVTTLLQGPADADVALQAQVIEDLIAQGVDALTVVPNSAEGLETVLGRAQ
ncbi:MAG: substrate-binding domain-containing protein, partial [Acidimicrobiaceae bacterium]|nr:substrate-binding domain-containing protein [Acidimicrobiaceae bacterium]